MGVYDRLGVTPVINAAGTLTRLGGTVMHPEVRAAMDEAARSLVPLDELQAAASQAIARICGSEAGYVTSGTVAGLTLATAAAMVGLDIVKMDQLPFPRDAKDEVIICRPHRNSYDHAYRAAGARLAEVGMSDRTVGVGVRETEVWEIEAAITDKTAAIAYTAGATAHPPLPEVASMAARRGVPVIVDAAGQLPPPSNLRRFIAEGADIVCFSAGKAMKGPQGTGILAGRRDLIASVALQQLDMDVTFDLWTPPESLIPKSRLRGAPRHGLGRGYKVAKEEIVGAIVALEMFTEERCRQDWHRHLTLLGAIGDALSGFKTVKCTLLMPRLELGFPVLEIQIDEKILGKTAYDIARALSHGRPPIHVGEKKLMDGSVMVHPVNLDEASTEEVLLRLKALVCGGGP